MHDMHSIENSGGGGRLFAGDGDRRLRPHHHHLQVLKCPRCDSSNTKFCYYNNYNLSQPRHFCKSCRRYWTKGGVLRNVPVGGGIRKTKRSTKAKSKVSVPSAERKSSNSENSSSDSTSLTANTTTANRTETTTPTATAEATVSNSTNSMPTTLLNFNKSSTRFFNIPNSSTPITTFDHQMLNQSSTGNISSEIGTFTSLLTSSTDQLHQGIPSFQLHQQNPEHVVENYNPNKLQWTVDTTRLTDQTGKIELSGYESRISNGGLSGTDEGLFDLTGTVDQSYWSQIQWNDDNHDYYLNYLP